MHVFVCTCMCLCVCTHARACVCVCTHACMYVCTCMHVCVCLCHFPVELFDSADERYNIRCHSYFTYSNFMHVVSTVWSAYELENCSCHWVSFLKWSMVSWKNYLISVTVLICCMSVTFMYQISVHVSFSLMTINAWVQHTNLWTKLCVMVELQAGANLGLGRLGSCLGR